MNLQSVTTHSPPPLTRQPSQTQIPTQTPSVQPSTHQPSTSMQGKVQQSQGQSETQAQLTSPQTLSEGQQQIQQQSPESLQGQHQSSTPVLQQTTLGQKLKQVAQTTGQVGLKTAQISSQVHDVLDTEVMGVKPLEQLGELMKSSSEPLKMGSMEIPTGESMLIEHFTGMSSDRVKGMQGVLETGQNLLKVGKVVHSIHDISNYQDMSDLGSKVLTASKETYCALGGESTLELGNKIVTCCQKQDFESTKEMVSALGKFAQDDSYVASTERSLIANTATSLLGSTTTSVLGMGVPLLSVAPLVMDGWNMKNTYSNWSEGKATGIELTQSVITTIGSGLGATVLPFVGPLAATGVNKVLSWFS